MLYHTVLASLALVRLSVAGYVLQDDYSGGNFFNMFNFYTGGDPTHGFVRYVDQGTASSTGLINTNGPAYIGVDHNNVTPKGRPSVRLESKNSYNDGLIIIDLAHMPASTCGTWPAFWMFGPNWPNNGEIDIIEGVNDQTQNKMTLHTAPGCTIENRGGMLGSIATGNCDANVDGNTGCGITDQSTGSYGTPLNNAGGAVFATEIRSDAIAIWRFARGSVPGDINSATPNPSTWGTPQALFQGGCDIDKSFNSLNIIFDTTFCGDWAGAVWGGSSCAAKAGTCNDYVANNPGAFSDSYWSVNSLKVFKSVAAVRAQDEAVPVAAPSAVVVSLPVASPIVSDVPHHEEL
ncbi:hypothetical protein EJ05DRAFT_74508 [Pseudovirgaria hyperparasitica]|uniref:endo-1,3(4)-beta-glucanase n=1 Tax=Pseudovirgaria hyperparasitica TaxID=470096 RepID=A0A6A6W1C3_9PEZI|nr:uncharacterized protein EJ05DRAFT_74508 [Pseudovirgaria hyperparasitica]KAF2756718.1 hypothetical protein EJ05DRAFT_74508 [Pseudovirgaria hyperparasitica]